MQGDAKEEVRARIAIEDVIGEYIHLKRAGRNYKGLSPFSGEKTASFMVSPEKQIWHDFSSNRGGDVFSFVMEVEGMDFRASLEHLARKAGVDLTQYESASTKEFAVRKKRLLEINDLAAKYFQASMIKNKKAIEYVFKDRKISKQIVTDFRIGYAPDGGQALVSFLTKKGYTGKELSDAGVVNRYGGDLFRGRMMVPLMDATGQVIGFTGRIIGEVENAPKYLNTPQTLLYDKGRHVFGLSQAKEAIRTKQYVVIVEGNMDVVSSHQAGTTQVVATAGTAMTEHQVRTLKRLTADIRLCFDGDKAGLAATERSIEIANQVGVDLAIISLPDDAKDPDELIQTDPALWQKAVTTTSPAVDWVIAQLAKREDMSSAAGKRAFTSAALRLVARLSDSVEREHYEDKVAKMIGSSREAIRTKVQNLEANKPSERSKRPITNTELSLADFSHAYQDDLLSVACIDAPSQELFTQFDPELLSGEQRQAVARYFVKKHGAVISDTPVNLHEHDTYVKILLLRADTRYAAWSDNDRYFETARLIRKVEQEHKKQTRNHLVERLRAAEGSNDEVAALELRTELNRLIKEIARGQR